MILTESSSAKVGASVVSAIISTSATFRQFMVYAATTISSVISGTIGLIKNGNGTLTLSGINTYTGATTINAGTLKFQANTFNAASRNYTITSGAVLNLDGTNNFAVGTSTIYGSGKLLITGGAFWAHQYNNGNISLGSGGTIEIASGATLYNGGWQKINWTSNLADILVDGTLDVSDGQTAIVDALSGSGTIDKGYGGATVTLLVGVDNGTGTFSGIIKNTTGSIALTKNGTGTQILSGNNTYSGTTTINSGTLEIGAAGRLGAGSYAGNISNNASLIYSGTNNQAFLGVISGTGALTKNASSTLTLSRANTYTGGTTVNAGTLQIGNGTNNSARVLGATTLSGGNLAYHYNSFVPANGAITLAANSTITLLNTGVQMNFVGGPLNGGGKTLNIVATGAIPIYFNQTAGTSLGQVNILGGAVGEDGNNGIPLRNAAINISSGAQFRTYNSPTINNNITLNGGAGPNGNGALWNEGGTGATPNYTGTITLAASTNSSIGNSASGFIISGQITGAGSLTKIGTGVLSLNGNNTYTGSTTISNGSILVSKTTGGIAGAATFTTTALTVNFNNVTPTTRATYQFFPGATSPTGLTITLTNAGGKSGTYDYTNSTLTIN